jgi:hypothetical protein
MDVVLRIWRRSWGHDNRGFAERGHRSGQHHSIPAI